MLRVIATYAAKMTERREQRIRAAFKQCDVHAVRATMTGRFGEEDFPIVLSDIDWTSGEDGTETELKIFIGDDDMERATRLASELRACGMVASVQRVQFDEEGFEL